MDCTQALDDFLFEEPKKFKEGEKKQLGCLEVSGIKHAVYNGENRIGRDPSCSISVNSKALSKEHAVIEVIDTDNHLIYDLGSRNKTRLGKMVLQPDIRYQLEDGARLHLADVSAIYKRCSSDLEIDDDSGSETGSESMLNMNNSVIEGTVIVPETPGPFHTKPKTGITIEESPSSASDADNSFGFTLNSSKNELNCVRIVKDENLSGKQELKTVQDDQDDNIFEAETQCIIDSSHISKTAEPKKLYMPQRSNICTADQEEDMFEAETQAEESLFRRPVKSSCTNEQTNKNTDSDNDDLYAAETQCDLTVIPNEKSKSDLISKENHPEPSSSARHKGDDKVEMTGSLIGKNTGSSSDSKHREENIFDAPTQRFPEDTVDDKAVRDKTDAASLCSERTEEYIFDDTSLSSFEDVNMKISTEEKPNTASASIGQKPVKSESETTKESNIPLSETEDSNHSKVQQPVHKSEESTSEKVDLNVSFNENTRDRSMLEGDDDFFAFGETQHENLEETPSKDNKTDKKLSDVDQKGDKTNLNTTNLDNTHVENTSEKCTALPAGEMLNVEPPKPLSSIPESVQTQNNLKEETNTEEKIKVLPSSEISKEIPKASHPQESDSYQSIKISLETTNSSDDETDPEDIFEAKTQNLMSKSDNEKAVARPYEKSCSESSGTELSCPDSRDNDIFTAPTQIVKTSKENNIDFTELNGSKKHIGSTVMNKSKNTENDIFEAPTQELDTSNKYSKDFLKPSEACTNKDADNNNSAKSSVKCGSKNVDEEDDEIYEAQTQIFETPNSSKSGSETVDEQDNIYEAQTQVFEIPKPMKSSSSASRDLDDDMFEEQTQILETQKNAAVNVSVKHDTSETSLKEINPSQKLDKDSDISEAQTQIVEIFKPPIKVSASNSDSKKTSAKLHEDTCVAEDDSAIFEAATQMVEPTNEGNFFKSSNYVTKQEAIALVANKSYDNMVMLGSTSNKEHTDDEDLYEAATQVIETPNKSSNKDLLEVNPDHPANSSAKDDDIFEEATQEVNIRNECTETQENEFRSYSDKESCKLTTDKSVSSSRMKSAAAKDSDDNVDDVSCMLTQQIDENTFKKPFTNNVVAQVSNKHANSEQLDQNMDTVTVKQSNTIASNILENGKRKDNENTQGKDKYLAEKIVSKEDSVIKCSGESSTDSGTETDPEDICNAATQKIASPKFIRKDKAEGAIRKKCIDVTSKDPKEKSEVGLKATDAKPTVPRHDDKISENEALKAGDFEIQKTAVKQSEVTVSEKTVDPTLVNAINSDKKSETTASKEIRLSEDDDKIGEKSEFRLSEKEDSCILNAQNSSNGVTKITSDTNIQRGEKSEMLELSKPVIHPASVAMNVPKSEVSYDKSKISTDSTLLTEEIDVGRSETKKSADDMPSNLKDEMSESVAAKNKDKLSQSSKDENKVPKLDSSKMPMDVPKSSRDGINLTEEACKETTFSMEIVQKDNMEVLKSKQSTSTTTVADEHSVGKLGITEPKKLVGTIVSDLTGGGKKPRMRDISNSGDEQNSMLRSNEELDSKKISEKIGSNNSEGLKSEKAVDTPLSSSDKNEAEMSKIAEIKKPIHTEINVYKVESEVPETGKTTKPIDTVVNDHKVGDQVPKPAEIKKPIGTTDIQKVEDKIAEIDKIEDIAESPHNVEERTPKTGESEKPIEETLNVRKVVEKIPKTADTKTPVKTTVNVQTIDDRSSKTAESKKPVDTAVITQKTDDTPKTTEFKTLVDVAESTQKYEVQTPKVTDSKKTLDSAGSVQKLEDESSEITASMSIQKIEDVASKTTETKKLVETRVSADKIDGTSKTESMQPGGTAVNVQKSEEGIYKTTEAMQQVSTMRDQKTIESDEAGTSKRTESEKPFDIAVVAQKTRKRAQNTLESKQSVDTMVNPQRIEDDSSEPVGTEKSFDTKWSAQKIDKLVESKKPLDSGVVARDIKTELSETVGAKGLETTLNTQNSKDGKQGDHNESIEAKDTLGSSKYAQSSGDETDPEDIFETKSEKLETEHSTGLLNEVSQANSCKQGVKVNERNMHEGSEDNEAQRPSPTLLKNSDDDKNITTVPETDKCLDDSAEILKTEMKSENKRRVEPHDSDKGAIDQNVNMDRIVDTGKFQDSGKERASDSNIKQLPASKQKVVYNEKSEEKDEFCDNLNKLVSLDSLPSECEASPIIHITGPSRLPSKRAKVRKRANIESTLSEPKTEINRRRKQPDRSSVNVIGSTDSVGGINRRRKHPEDDSTQNELSDTTVQSSKQRKLNSKDTSQNDSKNKASAITSNRKSRGSSGEIQHSETPDNESNERRKSFTSKKTENKSDTKQVENSPKRGRSKAHEVKLEESDEISITGGEKRGLKQIVKTTKKTDNNDDSNISGRSRKGRRKSVNKDEDSENISSTNRPSRQRKMTWKIRESLESDSNSSGNVTASEEKLKSRSRGSSSTTSLNESNENTEINSSRYMRSKNSTPTKSPSKGLLKSSEQNSNTTTKDSKGTAFLTDTRNSSSRRSSRQSKGDTECGTDISSCLTPQKTRQNEGDVASRGKKRKIDEPTNEVTSKRSRKEEQEKLQSNSTEKPNRKTSRGKLDLSESLKAVDTEPKTKGRGRKGKQSGSLSQVESDSIANISATKENNRRNDVQEETESTLGHIQSSRTKITRGKTDVMNIPSLPKELNSATVTNVSIRPQRGVKRTKTNVVEEVEQSLAKHAKYEKNTQNDKIESVQSPRTSRSRRKSSPTQKTETVSTLRRDSKTQTVTSSNLDNTKSGIRRRVGRSSKVEELKTESTTPKSSEDQVTTPKHSRASRGRGTPQSSQQSGSGIAEGTPSRRSTPRKRKSGSETTYQVLFTGFTDTKQEAIVKQLGGSIVDLPESCTVLVTDKVRRTYKFLCVMGRGIPIVSPEWLVQCRQSGHFIDPRQYLIKDQESESKFKFQLQKSLDMAARTNLLAGYSVHVTPKVKPPPAEMKGIVECCGGIFLPHVPKKSWPVNSFIISCIEDKSSWPKLKKSGRPIVRPEILLLGVLQQKLDLKSNTLV